MAFKAQFDTGKTNVVPYTPGSALAAGDVIPWSTIAVAIVHLPIAAGALGGVSVPNGNANYRIAKLSTDVLAVGDKLWWDVANQYVTKTVGALTHVAGYAAEVAGNGTTDVLMTHDR